jgi:hypothetical protein
MNATCQNQPIKLQVKHMFNRVNAETTRVLRSVCYQKSQFRSKESFSSIFLQHRAPLADALDLVSLIADDMTLVERNQCRDW